MADDHIKIDDVTPRVAYVATNGQTVFAVPFAFFADTDLKVYKNAVLLTLTTHYTVAGSGASEPVSRKVTLAAGAAVNDSIVIVRDIPIERTTDFPAAGPFNITSLNTQLDKLTAISQQLENQIERTLRLADSDTTANLNIPIAAQRANKFLGFDSVGDPVMSTAVQGTPVSAYIATLLDDVDAAAARNTLGIPTIANTQSYLGLSNWHHCR